jgi:hypothetical protein
MRRKTVVAFSTFVVAAGLLAPASEAAARMMGGPMGGRIMAGGFQRPMMQPMGPMRGSFAVAPQRQRFWPTVGNFEVKKPTGTRAGVYDFPGYYAQRFDGVDKGGGARGVGLNRSVTIHGSRTENIGRSAAGTGSSYLLDGGGFRGGVGVAASGKSSTYLRMGQPHTGAGSAQSQVRHRGFAIVDRSAMQVWPRP